MSNTLTHSTGNSVKFSEDEHLERHVTKKRNLTMKYGAHQIKLIQKRLDVEFWIDAELIKLYSITDPNETYPFDLDLDELLDIETETERRQFISELLKDCKCTDQVKKVITKSM